jgi:hypothetical protein
MTALRKFYAEEYVTLGIFAADGDPQYNQTHSIQEPFNKTVFSTLEAITTTRKFCIFPIRFTSSGGLDNAWQNQFQ